jgi:hypothetical protein
VFKPKKPYSFDKTDPIINSVPWWLSYIEYTLVPVAPTPVAASVLAPLAAPPAASFEKQCRSLGGCIVQGATVSLAIKAACDLGIYPGAHIVDAFVRAADYEPCVHVYGILFCERFAFGSPKLGASFGLDPSWTRRLITPSELAILDSQLLSQTDVNAALANQPELIAQGERY